MPWKGIIAAAAVFVLWKFFQGDSKRRAAQKKQEDEKLIETGVMVKDPICGAYVDRDSAIRGRDGENVYAFCGYECRDEFLRRIEAQKKDASS